jgi:4-hydroxybenzoate polyprenyltransferase
VTFDVALKLGRVSNLPTIWSNVLAGVVLAGGAATAATVVPLIVALSLFYVAGMFLNDAFDHRFDARDRPTRPIPSGQVSAEAVYAAGFAMIGAGLAVLILFNAMTPDLGSWRVIACGIVLGGLIVYYDWRHKGATFGPVVMGLCRVMVYVTAGAAVAVALPPAVWIGALAMLCYLIGLTYASKQEGFGRVDNLWPLALLAVPFVVAAEAALADPTTAALLLIFLAVTVWAVMLLVRRSGARVGRAIALLIAGISLLDAMLIAGAGAPETAWIAALGFPLTLAGQRWVQGT